MTEGFIRILNLLEIQDWEMGLLRDFLKSYRFYEDMKGRRKSDLPDSNKN